MPRPAATAFAFALAATLATSRPLHSAAPGTQARPLAARLVSPRTPAERVGELVEELVALGPEGVAALEAQLDRELGRLEEVAASRPKTAAIDARIAPLRDTLRGLRADPEVSKEQLQEIGLPALEALTAAWNEREAALAAWRTKADLAVAQADRVAEILQADRVAAVEADRVASRAGRLAEIRAGLAPDDPEADRVAVRNESLTKGLPADVVAGMTAVNRIRTICGLTALVFDPDLCEAAALHSGDMEAYGFFAHESPIAGRKTPWDRAALAGTTASGENIFMGSALGSDAIKAWFLSPGHHRNMFGDGHTRQGLGRAGSHWTQLFGN